MRSQRLPYAAPCLAGSAENLPFDDQSFDAAMAFSTIHHWQDPIAGLREMRRVARRVVVFTFGPDAEQSAVHSLRNDLASGRWAERNRDLLDLDAAELGARLLIA
jgi:SAM-dependent methyltransferase